jgi:hypothetical protein
VDTSYTSPFVSVSLDTVSGRATVRAARGESYVSPDRKHQPRHRHSHVERRWSVDDALREYAKLIRWYDSADGVREAYNTYRLHYGGVRPASLPDC